MKLILRLSFIYLFLLNISSRIYSQAGTLDKSFGIGGKDTLTVLNVTDPYLYELYSEIDKILIQQDQKIVSIGNVGYESSNTGGIEDIGAVRWNVNGILDSSFGTNAKILIGDNDYFTDAALQLDDKILMSGGKGPYPLLVRFNKNGLVDSSFGLNGSIDTAGRNTEDQFNSTNILSDNSIIVSGLTYGINGSGSSYNYVEKYSPNGVKDKNFGEAGRLILRPRNNISSVRKQPDDKIIFGTAAVTELGILGNTDTVDYYYINRITSLGKYDSSFGDSGKILIGQYSHSATNDTYFSAGYINVLNDGKIITFNAFPPLTQYHFIRYMSNGNVDSSFGTNGIVLIDTNIIKNVFENSNSKFNASNMLVQPDGKVLLSGIFGGNDPYPSFAVLRFNSNGEIDSSFGNNGLTITDFKAYTYSSSSALQKDNKILLGGYILKYQDDETQLQSFAIARYNNDDNILPVSLLSFTATKQQQSVLLNWQTVNEINNSYFSIERSNNSRTFTEINKVYAKEIAQQKQSYTTTDTKPLQGINYYRLKQVDKDGKFTYSKIASVFFDDDLKITVRPNPANNFIYVDGLKENISANVSITDVNGKTVSSTKTDQSTSKINIQHLAAGVYYININQNGKSFKQKFIKQ